MLSISYSSRISEILRNSNSDIKIWIHKDVNLRTVFCLLLESTLNCLIICGDIIIGSV